MRMAVPHRAATSIGNDEEQQKVRDHELPDEIDFDVDENRVPIEG